MLGMSGDNQHEGMSAYELKRLENIRQNQKILQALEIPKLAPAEKVALNSADAAAKSKKKRSLSSSSSGRRAPLNVLPMRTSSRLKEKMEEEQTGRIRRKKAELLTEFPEPQVKERKPRPLPGSRMLFDPEHGPTDGFLSLLKHAHKDVLANPYVESVALASVPRMGIKSQAGVCKVLQERIYSVVLHPSTNRIIAATGSKNGQLAIWDATALYYDHDTTFGSDGGQAKSVTPYYLFHPHSGSLATLRYNPGNATQLLSCGYEGSIMCMDMQKGCFDTVYSAPNDFDEQYISTFDFFGPSNGNEIAFSDMSGYLSTMDRRSSSPAERFHLHHKKIGGMSVSPVRPELIATCSLDNVVCIWDRRALKPSDSLPLAKFDYKRAVTAVQFHPTKAESLVSTCYDDHVRIHHDALSDAPTEIAVRHNNQTGRWITTFKACWDPKSTADTSHVVVGDMNRGVDLIDGKSGITHNFTSEFLTAQPAVNGCHPTLDLIVSGNASGKLALWTPF